MTMPGRNYNAGSGYRYGFNGKENDKDISEGGQDYGMRIYDARIGKFLSVDPLYKEYPWNSTYAFAENDVIRCIDLDGLEKLYYTLTYKDDKPVLTLTKTETEHWTIFGKRKWHHNLEITYQNLTYTFNSNVKESHFSDNPLTDEVLTQFLLNPTSFRSVEEVRNEFLLRAAVGLTAEATNRSMPFIMKGGVANRGRYSKATGNNNNTEPSINLTIKGKANWSAEQNAAAQEKAKALTNSPNTVVTKNPEERISNLKTKFTKAGGILKANEQVDHVNELQLGGTNAMSNLKGLDGSVNASFGKQIQVQIKNVQDGTRVNKVTFVPYQQLKPKGR